MFKLLAVTFLLLATTTAFAQSPCTIGVFGDAQGTSGSAAPVELVPFNIYVVLFTEDLANACAYRLSVPSMAEGLVHSGTSFGPSGGGIGVTVPLGQSAADADLAVGIGECAVGFGGNPILVTTYTFLPLASYGGGTATILPNINENPSAPVYSTCQGLIKPCSPGQPLIFDAVIPVQSKSVSMLKALYN